MLAAEAVALGQEFEARKENLKREFSARLSRLIASLRDDATPAAVAPVCANVGGVISFVAARERFGASPGLTIAAGAPNF